MAYINFDVTPNSTENKSYAVLRSNPLLTTNVKLVVDSDGELYLDSFSANRDLSSQQYKKFALNSSGNYAYDLAAFYNDIPLDRLYDVWRKDSDLSVYTTFEKQYEEQYQYGARLNDSKLYEDNIRFLAPLWLDSDLPEYFVIYRIDEPVSTDTMTDDRQSINSRVMNMLQNATLVKTFDLRESSKVGNYLNTYVNDPKFPLSPLTVSFESDEKTSWNGIDLIKGGFVSKGEYIFNDFAVKDRQEILNNQFITEGFKRNKIACANLINLEFIFNDATVEPYDVNRYVGFYVKAHTEGQFKATSYRKGHLNVNPSTVSTTYDLTGTSLTAVEMLPTPDLNLPVLQWVKNRDVFYNVLNTQVSLHSLKVPAMEDAVLNGFIEKKDTLQVKSVLPSLKDFLKIEIVSTPITGERYAVASKNEWDSIGTPNTFTLTADSSIAAGKAVGKRFSSQGSHEKIAFAFAAAVNNIQDNPFNVFSQGSFIYIEHNSVGNRLKRSFFASYSTNTSDSFDVLIGEHDNVTQLIGLSSLEYTEWQAFYPIGGSDSGLGFLVEEQEVGDIDLNTYIKTRDDKHHRIADVVEDLLHPGKYRVCLSSGKINPDLLFGNSFNLYVDSYVEWGKFEACDFVDFDTDFFSVENSKPTELQYETLEPLNAINGDLFDLHFDDSSPMTESLLTYYSQLNAVQGVITPFSSGVNFISSEYDRLQENYLKDTATLSRTVPFINKWVYKNGLTAREKPYFLTTSEAFGKTNFAPDLLVSGRQPKSMTHEWFYLYKYPKYSSVSQDVSGMGDLVRNFYSYIQPEETINLQADDLMSVSEDWFNRLFIYEGIGIDGVWVPTLSQRKYSTLIKGSPVSPPEAMFRGLKVKVYSRTEFSEANPRNLISSSEFNGYKFSAVLNYNYDSEDQLTYKVIQNKKWKTITFYIELNTSEDNLDYVNRRILYSMTSFLDDSLLFVSSNVSGYLNFSACFSSGINTVVVDGVNTSLLRDVQLDSNGSYGKIAFDFSGYTFELQVLEVLSDRRIRLQTDDLLGNVSDVTSSITLNLPSLTAFQSQSIDITYNSGGFGLAASMFSNVGIQFIADLINSNNTETIQYLTVEEDGTVLPNRFIINIEDGNQFVKKSTLRVEADPFKPKSYKVSSSIIGFITTELAQPVDVTLIRMNGDYSPAFRPVVTFTDLYKHNKLEQDPLTVDQRQERVYSKFNLLGIAFACYDNFGNEDYGIIKNSFYHKVNPERADGILKLSQSGDASPVYPLINEVAIEKRDMNVFRSSWEDSFYARNGNQGQQEFVFGTLSAHEESAYLASTLNLPRDSYDITSYGGIRRVDSFQQLKDLKTIGNFTGNAAIYEDESNVWIDLYLKSNAVNLLVNDNAGLSIKKYVQASQSYGDKTQLDDDVKQYIEVNLLSLLGIEEVRVWNKPTKTIQQSELLSATSLQAILDDNLQEEKSFRLEYDPSQPLNARLIYNKRPGFRHQFYVYVKISS